MCPVDGTEPSGSFVFKNYSSGDTCRVDCTCVLNLIRIGYHLFWFVTGKTSFNILSTHLRKSSSKWKFRLPIVALKWDMPWSCTRIGGGDRFGSVSMVILSVNRHFRISNLCLPLNRLNVCRKTVARAVQWYLFSQQTNSLSIFNNTLAFSMQCYCYYIKRNEIKASLMYTGKDPLIILMHMNIFS